MPVEVEDCGHAKWTLGCQQCFSEMERMCKGEVRVDTAAAMREGAILFNWHILLLFRDFEAQLEPLIRSLDLHKVEVAKDLLANIRQIEDYLIRLVDDDRKLMAVLATAAQIAKQVKEQLAREAGSGEAKDVGGSNPSGIVITG